MGNFIIEHKQISFFVFFMVILYFFIFLPAENLNENIKNMKSKTIRLKKISEKERIIMKNIENLKIQKENFENEYEIKLKNDKNFSSLGEFQKDFNKLFVKNNIEILEIGRGHIENNTDYEIPYKIRGKEQDVINFLLETDKNEMINILKSSLEMKQDDEDIILLFSVNVKIKNIKENIETAKRETDFFQGDLKIIKFNLTGKGRGIFYIKDKIEEKRYYLKTGKKEIFNGKEYDVEILGNRLILKDEKNNKIVFDLEEEIENIKKAD